ncbi:MAG: histidine phosphatase family protein [Bifidobacterium mongoliense]|jgi:phosphohistidine phosphatase|uniref:SixA phosphatase family protein n=1 Tax=Bifidobacterium mongoliense TaxID=518643 RepID=UPI002F35D4DC
MAIDLKDVAARARRYGHLVLMMRHAKTESSHAGGDAKRELTDKGLKQAKAIARALAGMDLVPDRIACSSARRAEHTLERMLRTFGDAPHVDYRRNLYDQGLSSVFDELSTTKPKVRSLMIIGHEPTISMACQWIADPEEPAFDELNLGLSPASVVILGADEPIAAWREHGAHIVAVLKPKHLP